WILTLNTEARKASLPPVGKIATAGHIKGNLYLTASYTDKGGAGGIQPLTAKKTVTLRNNALLVGNLKNIQGMNNIDTVGGRFLLFPGNEGSFSLGKIDLVGISGLELSGVNVNYNGSGFNVEIRQDSKDGALLGKAVLSAKPGSKNFTLSIPMQGAVADNEKHDLFVVSKNNGSQAGSLRLSGVKVMGK
ncbi:MAG: hypothetical protein ABI151_09430, partial [Chitinophagaceae bacterium]